jgi:hypothetical protein
MATAGAGDHHHGQQRGFHSREQSVSRFGESGSGVFDVVAAVAVLDGCDEAADVAADGIDGALLDGAPLASA